MPNTLTDKELENILWMYCEMYYENNNYQNDTSAQHLKVAFLRVKNAIENAVKTAQKKVIDAVMEEVEKEGYTETCEKCCGFGCEKCNEDGYTEYNYGKFRKKLERKLELQGVDNIKRNEQNDR